MRQGRRPLFAYLHPPTPTCARFLDPFTQVPTEAPSSRPTTWPTVMPTTAPTPLAPSDQWARVATGQIFAGGITVEMAQERPGRELKATPADRDPQGRRRELAAGDDPTIQACFEACLAYFGPNYAQFFFNVIQSGTNKTCQCCTSADVLVTMPGGQAFANCISGANLVLKQKISVIKARPGKALNIKATVKARYTAMTLTGLALAITFPQPNVTLTKTGSWPRKGLLASVQTTASTVVWPQFDLAPGNKRTFKAGFRVSRSTPPTTVHTRMNSPLPAA